MVAFFLSRLARRSEMVNGAREGNCRRIIHHLPVVRYRPAQLPLCPYRDGKEEIGGEALAIAWSGWLPTGFADARFLPAAGLPVRAVWPSTWLAHLALLPVLGAIGGTDLWGLGSLDC